MCASRDNAGVQGTIYATLAWNQDGSAASGMANWEAQSVWTGGAKDVSDDLCPPGSGLRVATGEDGGAAADYEITDLLIPNEDYAGDHLEWLLFALAEQTAAFDGAVSAGATSVTLNSTVGLLDAGTAVSETDTFTYTGRTSTTLTGVSGIGNHANGALVQQVIDSVAQTGWPCSQLELLRPANTALPGSSMGAYLCSRAGVTPPSTPPTADWQLDYDGSVLLLYSANTIDDVRDYGRVLQGPDGGPRWTQYVLVVFDDMAPAGQRARLNECKLYLAQTQINGSGTGDIGSITAYGLANYIFRAGRHDGRIGVRLLRRRRALHRGTQHGDCTLSASA